MVLLNLTLRTRTNPNAPFTPIAAEICRAEQSHLAEVNDITLPDGFRRLSGVLRQSMRSQGAEMHSALFRRPLQTEEAYGHQQSHKHRYSEAFSCQCRLWSRTALGFWSKSYEMESWNLLMDVTGRNSNETALHNLGQLPSRKLCSPVP
jgi:hypothetical protein